MYSSNSYVGLRRVPTRLLMVGGLHLVVFWALLNGLDVHPDKPCLCANIVADMIDQPTPPPERVQPVDIKPTAVKFTPTPPPPVINIEPETIPDTGPPVRGPDLGFVQTESSAAVAPAPQMSGAAVDPRHPLTQPDYPASARRADEQGKVALQVLVGTDGRVKDVKVLQSSGFPRLDQAAVNEALARWRLRPATRDGQPFEQWITLGVVFRLENR